MENIYVETAKMVLGTAKRASKSWLCGGTWKKVEERRQLKMKLESTCSERVKQRIREQYKGWIKERTAGGEKECREDKRRWLNEMAGNAEREAENGRTWELHRILKTMTGEKRRLSTAVNDKNGRPTNERSRRLKIWKEHFDAVLNEDPPPIQPHEMERRPNDRECDIGPFRPTEVKSAIKATKNGRQLDSITYVVAKLLKTDLDERTKELTKLFKKVKEEGVAPKSWNRGLIVKLPKKGDLRECTNWRGITLLPVISKIFGRVLISRIKKGVDNILRKEQACFRENRGTIDQIFALRNILQQVNGTSCQCTESQKSLSHW